MTGIIRRKAWPIAGVIAALMVFFAGVTAILNPRLTSLIESDEFRAAMEKETAKGLHFPSADFEPIKRTGIWTAQSAGFRAKDGWKALSSIEAHGIRAKFNPWGVLLRRWQLDYVEIQSGKVGIQVYEPKPTPTPSKPWYSVFLPDRVYLKRVESLEPVDVTWEFRKKAAGFFGTHLLITPHGRDFEYQARGGEMKMSLIPDMRLEHTHLLITKTLLTLYNLDLQSKSSGGGGIHAEGTAGTRDDKSVDFKISLDRFPLRDCLPNEWSRHANGQIIGRIHWTGKDTKLESSAGEAGLRVENAEATDFPFLKKIAAVTGEKELEHLQLNECKLDLEWRYPEMSVKKLLIEDKGKIRAEGAVAIHKNHLSGAIQLGVARRLLDWLPQPEDVFPSEHDGYMWTTVRLSGTLDEPRQDLSPRIVDALKESPGAALGLLFRGLGTWLRKAFGRE